MLTLTAFFAVVLVAIAVLQPSDSAAALADWLAAIAVVSLVLTVRPLRDALVRGRTRALGLRTIAARFVVSALAFAGPLACASLLAAGRTPDALSLLLVVVVLLLVVSVRKASASGFGISSTTRVRSRSDAARSLSWECSIAKTGSAKSHASIVGTAQKTGKPGLRSISRALACASATESSSRSMRAAIRW